MWSRSFSSNNGILFFYLFEPGDRVEFDESIAEIETGKITIDIITPEAGFIQEFLVKQGDIVEPGMKVAIISKSGEGATTHVTSSIFES
ncbi:hypothetical protein L2E82_41005 [Cichorium intybus]|uniref:Uncharacterized protein n=1 Tax=Cichorium intybus TaxID=13427 RepID=A0ACB9AN18_CICIN|nr:hypothetical protein L2E82_41005 [Cichorium intybus]